MFLLVSVTKGAQSDNLRSRWAPLPHNRCNGIMDFIPCPSTTKARAFREKVCLGSTALTNLLERYHCQQDSLHKMTYEFLMEPFMCPKGYYGLVQYKSRFNGVRIVCSTCPDDRYQPVPLSSPLSLQGCHYARKVVHSDEHLLLYRKGTPSSPDIYYCDFLNGFYNEYRQTFCDGHHPCRCLSRYERPICIDTFDTLPDGSCRSKCFYPRLADYEFECVPNHTSSINVKLHNYTISTLTTADSVGNPMFAWTALVVFVVVGVFVGLILAAIIIYYLFTIRIDVRRNLRTRFMNVIINAQNLFHLRGRRNIVNHHPEQD